MSSFRHWSTKAASGSYWRGSGKMRRRKRPGSSSSSFYPRPQQLQALLPSDPARPLRRTQPGQSLPVAQALPPAQTGLKHVLGRPVWQVRRSPQAQQDLGPSGPGLSGRTPARRLLDLTLCRPGLILLRWLPSDSLESRSLSTLRKATGGSGGGIHDELQSSRQQRLPEWQWWRLR